MGAQPAKPSKKSRVEEDRTHKEDTFAEATSKKGSIDAMTTIEDWDLNDLWDLNDHRSVVPEHHDKSKFASKSSRHGKR
ncbi:unnamed protein product [Hydatigera taeniaeformis]|uniref:NUC153 domain-containing protein n=1 Tax=Hydatigena taeniaeformis TaxID=6205 RepID=A0A0R3WKL3_HYDTA|nr:unnamed protein product [Hydatigera taeniaeformis]